MASCLHPRLRLWDVRQLGNSTRPTTQFSAAASDASDGGESGYEADNEDSDGEPVVIHDVFDTDCDAQCRNTVAILNCFINLVRQPSLRDRGLAGGDVAFTAQARKCIGAKSIASLLARDRNRLADKLHLAKMLYIQSDRICRCLERARCADEELHQEAWRLFNTFITRAIQRTGQVPVFTKARMTAHRLLDCTAEQMATTSEPVLSMAIREEVMRYEENAQRLEACLETISSWDKHVAHALFLKLPQFRRVKEERTE